MRRNEHIVSVKYEPKGQSGEEVKTGISGAVSQGNALTPEFYDLIYEADPGAENDDYYVTSADFIELHSQIKKDLVRGLVWYAVGLCFFMAGLVLVYV